ncbi:MULTISPECIES: hypothetical protein [Vreelandella]|uniref:Outer membrane protein beta-barrel domain-containing protein n=2 Tax=Vreelandella TaxID=3137766 RepID=A0A7C9P451_9GAMM|nr:MULTISPECIES: hypothetical protein [Halomonas]NDL72130.1 hypothetical protein [Halomonas alkaliphila]NYS43668.1 hypothetical protein [Halomonas zhaodongensis]
MKRLASTLLYSIVGSTLPLMGCYASDGIPVMAYASPDSELLKLGNGVVLEGSDLSSLDTYTSGFRLTAGYSPWQLPRLDIGAEIAYRESEEVPISSSVNPVIMDTLSLGGAVVAGVRLGAFSVYAKSGFTEWRGEADQPLDSDGGTAFLQGFGATMTNNRLVSRLEYERIDAPTLSHLNMLSASLHLPF